MVTERLRREGATVVCLNTNPLGRRKPRSVRFLRFLPELRKLRGCDVALIFAGSYASFFAFSAVPLLAARLLGTPSILMYKGGLARFFFRRYGWLVRPFARLARAIVVPGRFLQSVFEVFGMRAHVLPDLIDVSGLPERRPAADPPLLLVPRRFDYVGGVDLAVRAFGAVVREFPSAELHLCGDGDDRPQLERLAEELAPGRVHFHGFLPHEELMPLLARATALVNPTRDDNHPNSVLEAMWVGVPVLATAVGGVPFLLRDGATGFLARPDEAEALAERILYVLKHPEEAAAAAARAREAAPEFIWPSDRPGLLGELLELAGGDATPPTTPDSAAPSPPPA
ncbi:MAG: glycosyltransferase family 4 protein [Candidatus Coatesbacteria bacterium]|nr:MAG: glycosyltransferase family 4 protein [Candidatus Coatesbacteria bacterium]